MWCWLLAQESQMDPELDLFCFNLLPWWNLVLRTLHLGKRNSTEQPLECWSILGLAWRPRLMKPTPRMSTGEVHLDNLVGTKMLKNVFTSKSRWINSRCCILHPIYSDRWTSNTYSALGHIMTVFAEHGRGKMPEQKTEELETEYNKYRENYNSFFVTNWFAGSVSSIFPTRHGFIYNK